MRLARPIRWGIRGRGMGRWGGYLCQKIIWIGGQVGMLFQIGCGHSWGGIQVFLNM